MSNHYFFFHNALHSSLPLLNHTKSVSRNTWMTRASMWLCRLLTMYNQDINALQLSDVSALQASFCESAMNPFKSVVIL